MPFTAQSSKPCTHCNVVIEKGTSENLTWDRLKGGFIHLSCLRERKLLKAGATAPRSVVSVPNVVVYHDEEPTQTAPASTNGDDVGAQLARMIQSLAGQRGIDEAAVRRIAADEASKVSANRSLTVTIGEVPAVKLDLAHKDIGLLLKLSATYGPNGHRLNIYMHGPAGSGKSTAAHQVANVLFDDREENARYGYISLNPQTPESRLIGFMQVGGQYVETEFFRRYVGGGVFCLDEIDNAAASMLKT